MKDTMESKMNDAWRCHKYGISITSYANRWQHGAHLARICCLVLALLLSACTPSTPEPPLRIGTNIWPGYEPLYLARSLGHYKDTPIKLVELLSASEVIHALRNKTLEGAALTLDEAMTLMDDGFDLKVILVMDFSNGGDVLLAKPEIASLAALRGKRIAVEYTAVGAILLDAALDAAGLKVLDITIVSCRLEEHLECYGSADAVVTFDPFRTKLLNQGARLLFDSRRIPSRIVDVLVVLEETTKTHPRGLEELLAGYFKAREHLASQPEDASKRMAIRLGLSSDEVLASYDGLKLPTLDENHSLLNGKPPQLVRTAGKLAEFMRGKKWLKNRLEVDGLMDGRFLPGATP